MTQLRIFISSIVMVLVFAVGAIAQVSGQTDNKRVAFVVGNSAYQGTLPELKNPVNDAQDMAVKLEELGFEVIVATDLSLRAFRSSLLEFATAMEGANTSLFFYAGHGVQVNDENHLIPIDAQISRVRSLADETITVNRIVGLMNQFTDTSIVLLDACRDNPLTSDIPIGEQQDGFGRGLARVRADGGSYIAFATAPGNVAYDGEGRNSPFTTALLQHISAPNLDIRLMMADVRRDVFEATQQRQLPWENNSLIGRFFFDENSTLQRLDSANRNEVEAWQAIANSNRREDYTAFMRDFPDGNFASVAELKVAALGQAEERASEAQSGFVLARATNTEDRWEDFLEKHPQGLLSDIAREELRELRDQIERDRMSLEEMHWRSIAQSRAPSDFRTYLSIYSNGPFSDLARDRLEAAERAEEIVATFTGGDAPENVSDVRLEQEIKAKIDQIPVQFIQYGLNALGHQVTDISGVLDPPTRRAVRNYQATIEATQTGRLTPTQTVDLLLSAAALGDSYALTATGIMLTSGQGLRKNEEMARQWLDRAADLGNGLAMANLGILYRDGLGGDRNLAKARSLLTVAVTLGVQDAEPVLRSLGK
ncbi:MAG: caspase family protein [Paracoccaceae bacterium]